MVNINDIIENKDKYYHEFRIPKHRSGLIKRGKSTGVRVINAPVKELKAIQRKILHKYLYKYKPTEYATGFRTGYNIAINAKVHQGAIIAIRIDIKDFFPSITKEMIVKRMGQKFEVLAEICTKDGVLPQGAPTSPALANLVACEMDRRMAGLAEKHQASFTRYADDLIFSSKTNKNLNKLIPMIYAIIKDCGFQPNEKKTKIMRSGERIEITGLTANVKPNVPRCKVRIYRAILHNTYMDLKNKKIKPEQVNMMQLKGYASFMYSVNQAKGKKAFDRIAEIEKLVLSK